MADKVKGQQQKKWKTERFNGDLWNEDEKYGLKGCSYDEPHEDSPEEIRRMTSEIKNANISCESHPHDHCPQHNHPPLNVEKVFPNVSQNLKNRVNAPDTQ